MKRELLGLLACPECHGRFSAQCVRAEGNEIMEGTLCCSGCGNSVPIIRGIPRFVPADVSKQQQATAQAFGYEWTRYSQLTNVDDREFLGWISPLTQADFADRVVLDAGCGKGRHIFLAAQYKARTVVGIDISCAVEAAYQNTRALPNVHVIQADIHCLPFSRCFDLVYSIGVLHHLPDPRKGFLSLLDRAKPGGRIAIWVYGKEGNLWIERFVDPIRKNVTSRLPRLVTRCLCLFPAIALYLALKLAYHPARESPFLKRLLPYSEYLCWISDYSFKENFWNVFDQLVAPTAYYHSREELLEWFQAGGIQETKISRHNNNSWRGTGTISSQLPAQAGEAATTR